MLGKGNSHITLLHTHTAHVHYANYGTDFPQVFPVHMEQGSFPGSPRRRKRQRKGRGRYIRGRVHGGGVESRSPSPCPPFNLSDWDFSGESCTFEGFVTLGL